MPFSSGLRELRYDAENKAKHWFLLCHVELIFKTNLVRVQSDSDGKLSKMAWFLNDEKWKIARARSTRIYHCMSKRFCASEYFSLASEDVFELFFEKRQTCVILVLSVNSLPVGAWPLVWPMSAGPRIQFYTLQRAITWMNSWAETESRSPSKDVTQSIFFSIRKTFLSIPILVTLTLGYSCGFLRAKLKNWVFSEAFFQFGLLCFPLAPRS